MKAPTQFGEAHALLIGNSDYSSREEYDDLEKPTADVEAVRKFLKESDIDFGDNIKVLLDKSGEEV